jgi:hypothetical protein
MDALSLWFRIFAGSAILLTLFWVYSQFFKKTKNSKLWVRANVVSIFLCLIGMLSIVFYTANNDVNIKKIKESGYEKLKQEVRDDIEAKAGENIVFQDVERLISLGVNLAIVLPVPLLFLYLWRRNLTKLSTGYKTGYRFIIIAGWVYALVFAISTSIKIASSPEGRKVIEFGVLKGFDQYKSFFGNLVSVLNTHVTFFVLSILLMLAASVVYAAGKPEEVVES